MFTCVRRFCGAVVLLTLGLAACERSPTGDGEKAAVPVDLPQGSTLNLDFQAFRAERFSGPKRYPDFIGHAREYARFQNQIRRAVDAGPNYAGRYSIIWLDCRDTSCGAVVLVDLANGEISQFPLSSREKRDLALSYDVNSNLILADYSVGLNCQHEAFVLQGLELRAIGKELLPQRCPVQ